MTHRKSKMSCSSLNSEDNSYQTLKVKNCSFCFSEFKEENVTNKYSLKLYRMCCKYLHSTLTLGSLSSKAKNTRNLTFCPQCVDSAKKLVDFTEQKEFFDKRISELVFIFSVDILHRRGKVSDVDIQNNITYHPYRKKIVEVDIGTLSINSDSCDSSAFDFDGAPISPGQSQNNSEDISTSESLTSHNYGLPNVEKPIEVIIEGTMQLEGNLQFEDESIEIRLPIEENIVENNIPKANPIKLPILKLKRLQFEIDSMGTEVIRTECDSMKTVDNCDVNEIKDEILPTTTATASNLGDGFYCDNQVEEEILPSATGGLGNGFNEVYIKQEYATLDGLLDSEINQDAPTELSMPIIAAVSSSADYVTERERSVTEKSQNQMDDDNCLSNSYKEKNYKCDVCNKQFGNKSSLANHFKVHDRPYTCDVCGWKFSYKESFLIHKKTHMKIVHFKCDFCGKEFLNEKFLTMHKESTHTKLKRSNSIRYTGGKEKPFKCTIGWCRKKFKTKVWLKRHVAAHHDDGTPVKQFNCDKCDYVTDCPFNLKIHEDGKHKESYSFKCRECEKEFKTANVAEQHYKTDHFALDFSDDCIITL